MKETNRIAFQHAEPLRGCDSANEVALLCFCSGRRRWIPTLKLSIQTTMYHYYHHYYYKAAYSIHVAMPGQVFGCALQQQPEHQSESFFHNACLKAECLHNLWKAITLITETG